MRRVLILLLAGWVAVTPVQAQEPGTEVVQSNRPEVIALSLSANMPLQKNHLARLTFSLRHADGTPLTIAELQEVHTRKMHVLALDTSFTDFQHLHPAASTIPGDYVAAFTPRNDLSYRFWVDITPKDGTQRFLMSDLQGKNSERPPISKRNVLVQEQGSLKFTLNFDPRPLHVGQASTGTLTVSDLRGKPVSRLQPVLGAFAHVVAISEDYRTVSHVHPLGDAPMSQRDRGGPELSFHIEPKKPGFLKIFAQFKIDGKDMFVPFSVWVD